MTLEFHDLVRLFLVQIVRLQDAFLEPGRELSLLSALLLLCGKLFLEHPVVLLECPDLFLLSGQSLLTFPEKSVLLVHIHLVSLERGLSGQDVLIQGVLLQRLLLLLFNAPLLPLLNRTLSPLSVATLESGHFDDLFLNGAVPVVLCCQVSHDSPAESIQVSLQGPLYALDAYLLDQTPLGDCLRCLLVA